MSVEVYRKQISNAQAAVKKAEEAKKAAEEAKKAADAAIPANPEGIFILSRLQRLPGLLQFVAFRIFQIKKHISLLYRLAYLDGYAGDLSCLGDRD